MIIYEQAKEDRIFENVVTGISNKIIDNNTYNSSNSSPSLKRTFDFSPSLFNIYGFSTKNTGSYNQAAHSSINIIYEDDTSISSSLTGGYGVGPYYMAALINTTKPIKQILYYGWSSGSTTTSISELKIWLEPFIEVDNTTEVTTSGNYVKLKEININKRINDLFMTSVIKGADPAPIFTFKIIYTYSDLTTDESNEIGIRSNFVGSGTENRTLYFNNPITIKKVNKIEVYGKTNNGSYSAESKNIYILTSVLEPLQEEKSNYEEADGKRVSNINSKYRNFIKPNVSNHYVKVK